MEQILIRGLPAGTKAALRKRAEQNHRSAEAEARDALTRALRDEPVTIAEIERGVIAKERADPARGRSCVGGSRTMSFLRSRVACWPSTWPRHASSPGIECPSAVSR